MKQRFGKRITRLVLVTAALLAVGAGIAYATIPDSGNVYTACMLKNVGTIRLIDPSLGSTNLMSHCTSLETQVTWNQVGQQGPQGLQGPKGDQGQKGETGSQGAVGPAGTQGPKGDKGDMGPAGVQGPKGDKGELGPAGGAGPPGNDGAVGPAGQPGPQGPAGQSAPLAIRYVESSWQLIQEHSFTHGGHDLYTEVDCGNGWMAISGGAGVKGGSSDVQMVDSHPEGSDLHGWGVTLENSSYSDWHQFRVFAICVPPGASLQNVVVEPGIQIEND